MTLSQIHGRTAGRVLAEARALTEPVHRSVIDQLPTEIRHVAGYHSGWWNEDGQTCTATGKSIRPALAVTCALAAGADRPDGVRAGVCAELVHDFSLLHDDVMDGDLTRRHRSTSWALFGIGRAILVGDVLLTLAAEQAGALPGGALRVVTDTALELCAGQWSDLAFEERGQVTVEECLRMAEGKTGALLGAACQLGALAGGATPGQAEHYQAFGRNLGIAFQLVDDLLGIWGDPQITGKPAGADLAARKKSLPVVAALASDTEAGQHLAFVYGRQDPYDDQWVAHVADLVEKAGGRTWAQEEAERRLGTAFARLADASPSREGEADLRLLAGLITHRDH
uniref:Polyprenyl synthetase family protein n=1 Tax=Streptomyces sp. NBC_00049 TaxID=2903617 RepID=A0AAU2K172_9ACTN